jgi:hypothetical protein
VFLSKWKSSRELGDWIKGAEEDGEVDPAQYLLLELLKAQERERISRALAALGLGVGTLALLLSIASLLG